MAPWLHGSIQQLQSCRAPQLPRPLHVPCALRPAPVLCALLPAPCSLLPPAPAPARRVQWLAFVSINAHVKSPTAAWIGIAGTHCAAKADWERPPVGPPLGCALRSFATICTLAKHYHKPPLCRHTMDPGDAERCRPSMMCSLGQPTPPRTAPRASPWRPWPARTSTLSPRPPALP